MRPRFIFRRSPSSRAEDGFMVVEVLIAALVLTVGIVGLIGAFDSSRKLTLLSERRTAMAHRAQLEIERLQTIPYSELAMASAPTHSTEANNPDYYVKEGGTNEYQYGAVSAEAETLAIEGKGAVSATPTGRSCAEKVGACEWKDGLLSGNVYDFVTWHTDKNCGAKCPAAENYKRLTVAVTIKVPAGNHESAPIRVSTLIAEPH
jgi:Tfp pilus assembly protein PilV